MKKLPNCENHSSNPLQRKRTVILKSIPKAGHECTLEKSTNESEGKPEHKFDADFGTIFRMRKCFQTVLSKVLRKSKKIPPSENKIKLKIKQFIPESPFRLFFSL
jgi:hypothetical protein